MNKRQAKKKEKLSEKFYELGFSTNTKWKDVKAILRDYQRYVTFCQFYTAEEKNNPFLLVHR